MTILELEKEANWLRSIVKKKKGNNEIEKSKCYQYIMKKLILHDQI